MSGLLFGTGGTPHSAKSSSSIDGITRLAELGLGCMELEFVQGVRMGEAGARLVAETANREGIELSAHAPYYINLNAREPEKIGASQGRLLQTARIAALCGARSVVFHPAFYLGDPPEKAYGRVKKHLAEVVSQLQQEGNPVLIRPELMGKPSEFGNLEELLELSSELDGVAPCIDFAHCHARNGGFNSYQEFASVLAQIEERLGRSALDDMHIHMSGIAYGKKGEIKHLRLEDSDLHYAELLRALSDYEARGLLICESPREYMAEDALLLQKTYNNLRKTS